MEFENIAIPKDCLIARYEKASLFKFPEGTEYYGHVFYVPNQLYKDSTEIVDVQSDLREACYRIGFTEESMFKLKDKRGNEKQINAGQFRTALQNCVIKAHTARERSNVIRYNNTQSYEQNTPGRMRGRSQFVCMELTWNEAKGKFAKMLVNPMTGGNAQVDNPATWSSFDIACAAARGGMLKGRRIDGIGYVLTGEDGIVGVDLDLDNQKKLSAQGKDILEKLEGKTYIEHSVSGAIHAFGFGEKLDSRCKGANDNTIEMYGGKHEGNRCIMLTGNLYKGQFVELNNIQNEINEIHKKNFFIEPVERREHKTMSLTLSQNEVIERIRNSASAAKFNSLMAGDISNHESDYTRADLALCSIVAFFTQDASTIDAIYRQSQLYMAEKPNEQTGRLESRAEKWNMPRAKGTYGEQTIALALKNRLNTYTGAQLVDIEPQRVYRETDKAVMIKINDASAKNGKRFEWLPKTQIQTDKTGENVVSVGVKLIGEKGLLLKKNEKKTIRTQRP